MAKVVNAIILLPFTSAVSYFQCLFVTVRAGAVYQRSFHARCILNLRYAASIIILDSA